MIPGASANEGANDGTIDGAIDGAPHDAVAVVEVLGRDGEVHARTRVAGAAITIGRAYDNDVILDDPYVAACHVRIAFGPNGWVAHDAGSRNGLRDAAGARVPTLALGDDTMFRVGRTWLRLRTRAHPVPAERIDRGITAFERWIVPATALGALAGFALYEAWVAAPTPRSTQAYLIGPLSIVAAALMWAGIWAALCRLFSGHARFLAQLSVGSLGLVALSLLGIGSGLASFAVGVTAIAGIATLASYAVSAGFLWIHLWLIRPQRARRFAVVCAALAAIGIGVDLFRNVNATGSMFDKTFLSSLSYPALRMREPVTVDVLLHRADALRAAVDAGRDDRTDRSDQVNELDDD